MTTWKPMDYSIDIQMPVPQFKMIAGRTFSAFLKQTATKESASVMLIIPQQGSLSANKLEAWIWLDEKNARIHIGDPVIVTLTEYAEPASSKEEYEYFSRMLPIVFSARIDSHHSGFDKPKAGWHRD